MCDCVVCIAGILLLTDMKAWGNFEILGFGLQVVRNEKPEVKTKPPEMKHRKKRKSKAKEHSIQPIRLGLMLRPELLNPKLEM